MNNLRVSLLIVANMLNFIFSSDCFVRDCFVCFLGTILSGNILLFGNCFVRDCFVRDCFVRDCFVCSPSGLMQFQACPFFTILQYALSHDVCSDHVDILWVAISLNFWIFSVCAPPRTLCAPSYRARAIT